MLNYGMISSRPATYSIIDVIPLSMYSLQYYRQSR